MDDRAACGRTGASCTSLAIVAPAAARPWRGSPRRLSAHALARLGSNHTRWGRGRRGRGRHHEVPHRCAQCRRHLPLAAAAACSPGPSLPASPRLAFLHPSCGRWSARYRCRVCGAARPLLPLPPPAASTGRRSRARPPRPPRPPRAACRPHQHQDGFLPAAAALVPAGAARRRRAGDLRAADTQVGGAGVSASGRRRQPSRRSRSPIADPRLSRAPCTTDPTAPQQPEEGAAGARVSSGVQAGDDSGRLSAGTRRRRRGGRRRVSSTAAQRGRHRGGRSAV